MAEVVLGAIPDAQIKTGMFSSERWVLVVTDQRLIGARLSNELYKQIVEQARAQAKAQGAGFFGQWGAQLKASFGISNRYLAMTPEAILAETPGNWALYPGQVGEIKVEEKTRTSGEDMESDYLRITIATPGGKGSYETGDANPSRDEVRAVLARTFGSIVR
jgi:hypothetical protein